MTTSDISQGTFVEQARLLRAVEGYLQPVDVENVQRALMEERVLTTDASAAPDESPKESAENRPTWDTEYAISVALTMASTLHIDAVTLAAVLLYQFVEARTLTLADVSARLGGSFGEDVAETIEHIERFDALQRPAAERRRSAQLDASAEDGARTRRRGRERQREQDADALRKMFVAMADDTRVIVIKIAEQLRKMRAVVRAADLWRAHDGQAPTRPLSAEDEASMQAGFTPPRWSREECRAFATETREVYAPLAGRLGMGRVESELEDLAFAVLEPDEYRWLREAVVEETSGRRSYVDRVTAILGEEMEKIGIRADVSGRVKHLYSIYKKVTRTGTHDLTTLYDILAFRIIVPTVADCYLVLGHVHELWRPKDGRIKDFIANPKPNGYQSLHTTVFCLDDRLAEIQIRTREMHELAEYGVAMHWYYKSAGDKASASAKQLQAWVQQVKEWQQDTPGAPRGAGDGLPAARSDALKERIFVFTPAGDARELPAGATPLDFAYRIHSDLGNHVSGVRITSEESGRLSRKLVPLDYELRNGDVVEILKRNDAHPTRDWLRVVKTKSARDRIQRYLKDHERDIDLQRGRERLDRELRALGLRKGIEDLTDDELDELAEALELPGPTEMLVAIGSEKTRVSVVMQKVRELRRMPSPGEAQDAEPQITLAPSRDEQSGASVAGLEGMLTHLASCCNPLPGDDLCGFITRGRGVVIHRADCPNLRHLLEREPERAVAVSWPKLDGKQTFRAPILVEGTDRTGLLRDVTGVIANHKINMLKVEVVTKSRPERAIISAILEIQRPEDLESVLRDIRAVSSVTLADRKQPGGKSGTGQAVAGARSKR